MGFGTFDMQAMTPSNFPLNSRPHANSEPTIMAGTMQLNEYNEAAFYELELLNCEPSCIAKPSTRVPEVNTCSEDAPRKRMRLSYNIMEKEACAWALSIDCKPECKCLVGQPHEDPPPTECRCFNASETEDPMTLSCIEPSAEGSREYCAASRSSAASSGIYMDDPQLMHTPDSAGALQASGEHRSAFRRLMPHAPTAVAPALMPKGWTREAGLGTYQFCPQVVAAALENTSRQSALQNRAVTMHEYGPSTLSQRLGYSATAAEDKM